MTAQTEGVLYVFGGLIWATTVRSMGMILGERYRCRQMFWGRVVVGIVFYGVAVLSIVAGVLLAVRGT